MTTADELRARELLRLAGEIEADLAVLERLHAECADVAVGLAADPADRLRASFAALHLHRYYTAVENALERTERAIGAPPPAGPTWHRDLLWGGTRPLGDARPALLSAEAARHLEALLAFRHFVRHAYAVELDATRIRAVLDELRAAHPGVTHDLHALVDHLRAVATALASG